MVMAAIEDLTLVTRREWQQALDNLRHCGTVDYPLYWAIDSTLICEAQLHRKPFYYPELAQALHEELRQHGPRKARR